MANYKSLLEDFGLKHEIDETREAERYTFGDGGTLVSSTRVTAPVFVAGKNCFQRGRMERGLHGDAERSHGRSQSPRIGETGGATVDVLSSALVDCCTNPGGAAADEVWSCVKASHRVCTHFARLGEGMPPASNGEVVAETAEGHRVFATPPCKERRRLAVVVAAEALPSVIGGSFFVKGRNCALDVCWEVKKFRVICSHLNLMSVMHLYAKDLDYLRSMVTSR